ncbi:hypothetical protein AVEN_155398-1 [Araneus ventricosus]|uniref:Uncharacterized protein n=1 Tax=Araneus ventricosus TaxID=182803 RepID=A0A4Y2TJS5_ARAVE|nr:hypothetical protein AVEN_120320-1 [Araneus ventricosus]GBO00906.1 hypothetical protein AVEN_155398-1 [Araneus ventricosus]
MQCKHAKIIYSQESIWFSDAFTRTPTYSCSGDEEVPPPRQKQRGDNISSHHAEDISDDYPLSPDAENDDKPMLFVVSPVGSSMGNRLCDGKVG